MNRYSVAPELKNWSPMECVRNVFSVAKYVVIAIALFFLLIEYWTELVGFLYIILTFNDYSIWLTFGISLLVVFAEAIFICCYFNSTDGTKFLIWLVRCTHLLLSMLIVAQFNQFSVLESSGSGNGFLISIIGMITFLLLIVFGVYLLSIGVYGVSTREKIWRQVRDEPRKNSEVIIVVEGASRACFGRYSKSGRYVIYLKTRVQRVATENITKWRYKMS